VSDNQSTGSISKVATAGGLCAAIAISLPAVGVLGIQIGLLPPLVGFYLFGAGAVLGGAVSLLLGIVGLVITRGGADPDGRKRSLAALGGGVALLGIIVIAGSPGAGLPPINDITTDLEDPPTFESDPSGRDRDMSYPADWKPLVREAYPDLEPHHVAEPVAATVGRAAAAADHLGWTVTRRDASAGRVEATDATAIFRFVDDIVIRVRASGDGSVIDVRSKSRDGRGDVGANAARIRALLRAL
jgi:hypothetical protein